MNNVIVNKLGEKIYDSYSLKLERDVKSSYEMFAVDAASDLIQRSPYITEPLIDLGLIKRGEHTKLSPVFKANLSGQIFGASINQGNKFLTTNAEIRAKTITEYTVRNCPKIMSELKKIKKTEYDFYYGIRSSCLVESIQCDFISGVELSERAEVSAGIALIKRLYWGSLGLRKFMAVAEIDIRDDMALRQFANTTEFRNYISTYYENDLYFQRRVVLLEDKKIIVDDGDNVISLKKVKSPEFTEGLAARLINKLGLDADKIAKKVKDLKSKVV